MSYRGKQPKVPSSQLAAEYQAGATLRELAKRHGVSFQSLAIQLRNAGVERRPAHPQKYHEQPCAVCGAVFVPKKETHYTCSTACATIAKRRGHKAYCIRGHLLTEENLYPRYSEHDVPRCRLCAQIRARERWAHDPQFRARRIEQAREYRAKRRETT